MLRKPLRKRRISTAICLPLLLQCAVIALGQAEVNLTQCWSTSTTGARAIAASGESLYVSSADGRLESLGRDGKLVWAADLGGEIASNAAIDGNRMIVVQKPAATRNGSSGSSTVRILSTETGLPLRSIPIEAADRHFLSLVGNALIVVSTNGSVRALALADGSVIWKREIAENLVGRPYVNSERLIIGSPSGRVFVLSIATGEIELMRKLAADVTAAAETASGDVILGDLRGGISLSMKGSDEIRWRFKSGGSVSSVQVANGSILVASNDNFLYYIRPSAGSLIWKKRFPGRVDHVVKIDNELSLVSSSDENAANFLNLRTGRSVGQITLSNEEFLIADPVLLGGRIILLTNKRLMSYSLTTCGPEK